LVNADLVPEAEVVVPGPDEQSYMRIALQVLFVVAVAAAGLWLLFKLASVLLVLVLSTLFAYVIAPLVQLLTRPIRIGGRRGALPRGLAIALVYLMIGAALWTGAALLLPSATDQVEDVVAGAPAFTQSLVVWERGWQRYYTRLRIPIELRRAIDQSALTAGEAMAAWARGAVLAFVSAITYVPWLVLIPILAFLLLKDAPSVRRIVIKALPKSGQLRGHRLFEELNDALASYIRAQLVACLLIGTVCGIGFALLGVPYAVLLGVLAGIFEFIPLVGPSIVAVIATIVAALHAPGLALWVVVFLGALRVVHDYMIYPRLVGHGLHLHPFVIVLAVLSGAELGGLAGLFMAVPVVAMLSVVLRHWLQWRGIDAAEPVQIEQSASEVVP
jgi:predicted PurR-regulated permease PerM